MRRRSGALVVLAVVASLSACGDSDTTVSQCARRLPIASFTQTIRDQADFVGDVSTSSLRSDLSTTIATIDAALQSASEEVAQDLRVVRDALEQLREALSQAGWEVSEAMSYEAVSVALEAIDGAEVARANIVLESYFLQQCGVVPTVEDDASVQTLPTPTGVASDDSEPVTGAVDNDSDARAIGLVVGELFGLTLGTDDVDCLGTQLQEFVDLSDSSSSPSQYQRQFQKAFDACSIDFEVPQM